MRLMPFAATLTALTVSVLMFSGSAGAARLINTDLENPNIELNRRWVQDTTTVSPDTTSLHVDLPAVAGQMTVPAVTYKIITGDNKALASGKTRLNGTSIDVTLPAGVWAGLVRGSAILELSSPIKKDKYERAWWLNDWVQLRVNLKLDPAGSQPNVTIDLTGADKVYPSYSYSFGMPGGKTLTAKRGDTLSFTAPTTNYWTKGPDGIGAKGQLGAWYGFKPMCGASVTVPLTVTPQGCGGGIDGAKLPVKISPDGRIAYVTLPASLTVAGKSTPLETVWLNWYPKAKGGVIDDTAVRVVRKIHVS